VRREEALLDVFPVGALDFRTAGVAVSVLVVIGFGLAYSFFSSSVCCLLPRLSPGWAWGFCLGL
jgi:hypothetical protein